MVPLRFHIESALVGCCCALEWRKETEAQAGERRGEERAGVQEWEEQLVTRIILTWTGFKSCIPIGTQHIPGDTPPYLPLSPPALLQAKLFLSSSLSRFLKFLCPSVRRYVISLHFDNRLWFIGLLSVTICLIPLSWTGRSCFSLVNAFCIAVSKLTDHPNLQSTGILARFLIVTISAMAVRVLQYRLYVHPHMCVCVRSSYNV